MTSVDVNVLIYFYKLCFAKYLILTKNFFDCQLTFFLDVFGFSHFFSEKFVLTYKVIGFLRWSEVGQEPAYWLKFRFNSVRIIISFILIWKVVTFAARNRLLFSFFKSKQLFHNDREKYNCEVSILFTMQTIAIFGWQKSF